MPRTLNANDLLALMAIKDSAGWNQTPSDWLRLMRLEPEGCFCTEDIECPGRIVATATAITYEAQLAWIGMVLTLPEFRGRGYAGALFAHTISWLKSRGVRSIKLDATEMGRPLYEKYGFKIERPIERHVRTAPPSQMRAFRARPIDYTADRAAFGADRSRLLDDLNAEGHLHGRPGSLAHFFGPCVTADPAEARRQLETQVHHSPLVWDLFPENAEAVKLAREFGFEPMRRLQRMYLGGCAATDVDRIFACAGFEYG